MTARKSLISLEQVEQVFRKTVPLFGEMGVMCEELRYGTNRLAMPATGNWMRPINLFSGPAIMTMADVGMYIGVMSMIGPEPMTVTTSLTANFISTAKGGEEGGNLVANTRIIKCGRTLAYGEVLFSMEKQPERTVAHVTATYAIPPEPSGVGL